MSYEKQNFEDGQVLEAEHLNKMEDGIAKANSIIVTEGGDTLEWDGNTEGLVSFDFGGIMEPIYKVSNVIPSANDFVNGITMASDGEAITVDEAIMGEDSGILLGIDYLFMVVPAGVEGVEEGFYMNPAISSLTIPGYTGFAKEKIDPSYLPEHKHKWADIADAPFGDTEVVILEEQELAVADGMCTATIPTALQVGDVLTVNYDGTAYKCEVWAVNGNIGFGNAALMGMNNNTGEPFGGAYMDGMVMLLPEDAEATNCIVKISKLFVEKLPAKYYDAQAVFYMKTDASDNYLYTDFGCTIKATKMDVVSAARKMPIMVSLNASYFLSAITIDAEGDFAKVYYGVPMTDGSLVFYALYTAEYTAS